MFTRLLTGHHQVFISKGLNFRTRSGTQNCDYYDKPQGAINKKGGVFFWGGGERRRAEGGEVATFRELGTSLQEGLMGESLWLVHA